MLRYLVYLTNESYQPKDAKQILSIVDNSLPSQVVVRDVRISSKFIELDCSVPDNSFLDETLSLLGKVAPVIESEQVIERNMDKEDAILRAKKLFNEQRYWSSHEALEQVWRKASGEEKDVLNGLILAAAAFVHNQKGETETCLSIMKRAEVKLRNAGGEYYGIDVDKLKLKISEIIGTSEVRMFSI